MSQNTEHGTI